MAQAVLQKPEWLRIRPPGGEYNSVRGTLQRLGVNTVCVEAACPNLCRCWSEGTATFMILGKVCTRNCGFCNVRSAKQGEKVDSTEPERVALAVRELGLRYVVLTSVDRDDLTDLGAGHFAKCVRRMKELSPATKVEALIPDFQGREEALRTVLGAGPEVVGHNIEVVRKLQGKARDSRAGYESSLKVLKRLKEIDSGVKTKSGFMLGLGEREGDVMEAMGDLRSAGVDLLTLGQYLRPSQKNLPVVEYVEPGVFESHAKEALEMGFRGVAAGPFVRSSYLAAQLYIEKGVIL